MLAEYYLLIKALHVISIISWMAGLLYLPRLFVYHTQVEVGSEASEKFKVMERRLLRAIMTPAMIASWLFGLLILATGVIDLTGGLAACQDSVGGAADHCPHGDGVVAARLCRGPQSPAGAVLPFRKRGTDPADGRYCSAGDSEAFLITRVERRAAPCKTCV